MKPIKEIVRIFTPQYAIDAYHNVRNSIRDSRTFLTWRYKCDRLRYHYILHRLKHKIKDRSLNVLFLASYNQGWKYGSLYKLLEQDPHFTPQVLVCPTVNRGYEKMIEVLEDSYEWFSSKHYNVIAAYDKSTKKYINIKDLHPDIVFFTSPYKNQVDTRYTIRKIKHALTCYSCYGVDINPYDWCYALEVHQRVWRHFLGTQEDTIYVKKYCPWAISNRVVVGSPVYETIASGTSSSKDWKKQDKIYKRLIWAPHHTIDGYTTALHFSTFLLYADFMLDLSKRYLDKVQFVFKPHPLLRFNLEHHPDWGKNRTDAYYRQWEEGVNTNFVNGEYVDLFNSSDAMIHDCASFMFEYMCTQKPVMFIANSIDMGQYNNLGIALYGSHYIAKTKEDIIQFIEDVVLDGKDEMQQQRDEIYQKYILPPNGCTAAENMLNEIKKQLTI